MKKLAHLYNKLYMIISNIDSIDDIDINIDTAHRLIDMMEEVNMCTDKIHIIYKYIFWKEFYDSTEVYYKLPKCWDELPIKKLDKIILFYPRFDRLPRFIRTINYLINCDITDVDDTTFELYIKKYIQYIIANSSNVIGFNLHVRGMVHKIRERAHIYNKYADDICYILDLSKNTI